MSKRKSKDGIRPRLLVEAAALSSSSGVSITLDLSNDKLATLLADAPVAGRRPKVDAIVRVATRAGSYISHYGPPPKISALVEALLHDDEEAPPMQRLGRTRIQAIAKTILNELDQIAENEERDDLTGRPW